MNTLPHGLSARQFNGCLPRREEKKREEKNTLPPGWGNSREKTATKFTLLLYVLYAGLRQVGELISRRRRSGQDHTGQSRQLCQSRQRSGQCLCTKHCV